MTSERPWMGMHVVPLDEWHVVPRDDLIEHTYTTDCICGPITSIIVTYDDGTSAFMVTHHSLDGREATE